MKLRDYQQECLDKMKNQTAGGHLINLPTAAGKTVIFSKFASELPDDVFLILVHRDELVSQTTDKLLAFGIKAKIEKASSQANPEKIRELMNHIRTKRTGRVDGFVETANSNIKKLEQRLADKKAKLESVMEYNSSVELEHNKLRLAYEEYLERVEKKHIKVEALQKERKSLKESLDKGEIDRVAYKELCNNILKDEVAAKAEAGPKVRVPVYTKTSTTKIMSVIKNAEVKLATEINRLRILGEKKEELESKIAELDSECLVVVASVQTMHEERLAEWDKTLFDYVIFDEAHHLIADTWKAIRDYFSTSICFGFSATARAEAIGMQPLYKRDIVDLASRGYLSDIKHTVIKVKDYLQEWTDGDSDEEYMEEVIKRRNKKIILFANNVSQATRISERLNSLGITSGVLHCDVDKKDRFELLNRFKTGSIKVLTNYNIVSEGFDAPDADVVIPRVIRYSTEGVDAYTQIVGRGLRTHPGKECVEIVDIVFSHKQCLLPVIFGMHPDWPFGEELVVKQVIDAKALATKNRADLSKFRNMGFLMANEPIGHNGYERASKRRQLRGAVKGLFGGNAHVATQSYGKTAKLVVRGGDFYSPREKLAHLFKENLERELNVQPMRHIDPATVENKQAEDIQILRLRAIKYIRKYKDQNSFLKKLFFSSRKYPLSEAQCRAAIKIGTDMEQYEKDAESDTGKI